MNLLLTLRIAARALGKNKVRATLTVLGIVIGIAAVTTMVSIGQSADGLMRSQFEMLGTNVIFVSPGSERRKGIRQVRIRSLTKGDANAIREECPAVLASSAMVMTSGKVVYNNTNWSPDTMVGVDVDYLAVRNWGLQYGDFFTENDVASAAKVCVIGRRVVIELFQTANPLGETVRVNNVPFRVIGVLEEKGANMVGQDQDNSVLLPYTTVRKRLQGSNFDDIHAVILSAKSAQQMKMAEEQIRNLLMERHGIAPGDPPDFQVQGMDEIAELFGTVTFILTMLLASIAGISLLVGGVGIMNIMLVSVTERTREIGVRMAVGARGVDILAQFLVESVLLSCMGGVIGITLGIGASVGLITAINSWTSGTQWPLVISVWAAVTAILFATGVGLFFGLYPAWRASRLDPIEALRYE